MMTTPATGIKDEVRLLIDLQIETFRQRTPLTSSQLREFHHRSETLRMLCQELNRDRHKQRYMAAVGEGVLAQNIGESFCNKTGVQTSRPANSGRQKTLWERQKTLLRAG